MNKTEQHRKIIDNHIKDYNNLIEISEFLLSCVNKINEHFNNFDTMRKKDYIYIINELIDNDSKKINNIISYILNKKLNKSEKHNIKK